MKSELHEACARGLTGDVQLCLDRGADVHFATYDGTTALHIACKRGYVGVATLCLEHGAVVDSEKKTLQLQNAALLRMPGCDDATRARRYF